MLPVAHVDLAEVDGVHAKRSSSLLGDGPCDDDAIRLGVRLQASGNIHSVTIDIMILDNHVGDVDAHSECDTPVSRRVRLLCHHRTLHLLSGFERGAGAIKHRQEAVARVLDHSAFMRAQ